MDMRIPWGSWVLFGLASFAFVQTLSVYRWEGAESIPASLPLQRWALGLTPPPAGIQSLLLTDSPRSTENVSTRNSVPCDLAGISDADKKLSWSVEPLHTKGAFPSLILCGLLIWAGRMVFCGFQEAALVVCRDVDRWYRCGMRGDSRFHILSF